jgi:hypothetical protein
MEINRKFERIIVGYVGYIGFYLIFDSFLPFDLVTRLWVFALIYTPIPYLLLRNWLQAIVLALLAALSMYILGILFTYTYPIWPVLAIIGMIFAISTGLFRKP